MNSIQILRDFSVRGFFLGALAGGVVAVTTIVLVASKAGAQGSPGVTDTIPADPAEGEDAAIFAGWC